MRTFVIVTLTALATPVAMQAQTPTHTLPRAVHHAWGNNPVHIDSSVSRFRTQKWHSGADLPIGTLIQAITLRGDRNSASAAYTANIVIRLENTPLTNASLSTTLNNNLTSNATVAFPLQAVQVPALPPASHPNDDRGFWFVLNTPFVFTGPHLLIDIDEQQRVSNGTQYWDGAATPSSTLHSNVEHSNCGATLQANYSGGAWQVQLFGAPINQPVWFMLGFDNVGSGIYPQDLAYLGMPGCALGLSPFVTIAELSNATGYANTQIPYPNLNPWVAVAAQGLHLAQGGSATFATTNTMVSALGQSGGWAAIPSFDGFQALPGHPQPYNNGSALLLR